MTSILSFYHADLHIAHTQVLNDVSWTIHSQDRIAIIGRNGVGKSTLLKALSGELSLDRGTLQKANHLTIGGLLQDIPTHIRGTVYDILADTPKETSLDQSWDWPHRIETLITELKLSRNAPIQSLSGGMKRRVLLAQALLMKPSLLLLDEPTNHLDIECIEWLEQELIRYPGAVVFVTHDRTFLSNVAQHIVELDRGQIYVYECSYEKFLERREARRADEKTHNALFDKRLAEEEQWIRQGVEARRTRNEGRVRRLEAMREAYRHRKSLQGSLTGTIDVVSSGKKVFEIENLSYAYPDRMIVNQLSLLLSKGDKLAIVGPNGSGKTTLIRLLLKELTPDTGTVHHGTQLNIAYFDQLRNQLNESETVLNNLSEGTDYIEINHQRIHIRSYLKQFFFRPEQFNQPVFSLSGGEKNRLMLAKLFAKPMNVLIMDEPTNDLDLETLETLEDLLLDYEGTLILISHDRSFINNIATSVLVYSKEGLWIESIGGYHPVPKQTVNDIKKRSAHKNKVNRMRQSTAPQKKLSYQEQKELERLPQEIEQLESIQHQMHIEFSTSEFYAQSSEKIIEFQTKLSIIEEKLNTYYARWEFLEDKK